MRYFVCLLLMLPVGLLAQKADSFRNSVGFFGETNAIFGSSYLISTVNTTGVQYVRKRKEWLSYKICAGYAHYESEPYRYWVKNTHLDTIKGESVFTNINLGVLGTGIEVQRPFYKKLYFFAGFELRGGYGNGPTDTAFTKSYRFLGYEPVVGDTVVMGNTETIRKTGPDATMVYAGFTPYVGLKLEFKRFSIGTSFMNYFTYRSIKTKAGQNDNLMEFDASNITQQFFVRYKF